MPRATRLSILLLSLAVACADKTSELDDAAPPDDVGLCPGDARPQDAVAPDALESDAGMLDAAAIDASTPDAGALDGSAGDAATANADAATANADAANANADAANVNADAANANADADPADLGPLDTGPAPICGNRVIELGESCDDGDTLDTGNGCSTTCTRNNTCGNGVVESLFETCEPSLSGCCNPTCDGALVTGTECRAASGQCDQPESCDGTTFECPADLAQPNGSACTSCPAGDHCAGCYTGACLDSRAFCSDVLARGQSTGDGVYTVRPSTTSSVPANRAPVPVFCDMTTDGGGWTMVYKKSRRARTDGGRLWTGTATNTDLPGILDRELEAADYTNAFQNVYWGAFSEARVEVVTGTVTQKFIQFDLTGSSPTSWFAPDRHTSSSWTDLPTNPMFDNGSNQAFRIATGRSFYINRVWSGCPNDRGWLMISTINTCSWEQRPDPADIIYSKLTTESHIPNQTQTGYADTLVIFLR